MKKYRIADTPKYIADKEKEVYTFGIIKETPNQELEEIELIKYSDYKKLEDKIKELEGKNKNKDSIFD